MCIGCASLRTNKNIRLEKGAAFMSKITPAFGEQFEALIILKLPLPL